MSSVCVRLYDLIVRLCWNVCLSLCFFAGIWVVFVRSVEIEWEMWKTIRAMVMWFYRHVLIASPSLSQTDHLITVSGTSLTLLNKQASLSEAWFCQNYHITSANIHTSHVKQPEMFPFSTQNYFNNRKHMTKSKVQKDTFWTVYSIIFSMK